jgi:hypothetical protein
MPGGDHTGPLGQGPRTGRAAGYCAGHDMPGYMNSFPDSGYRGWRRGGGGRGGRGYGWRRRLNAMGVAEPRRGGRSRGHETSALQSAASDVPPTAHAPGLEALQVDLECLEQSAERIRRRIEELNAQSEA